MAIDDLLAIQNLKYAYFRHLDLKEFQELGDLLTDDVTAAYGDAPTPLQGRDAVVSFLTEAMSSLAMVTVHHGHHPEIDVSDDGTATGTWYLLDRVILLEHDLEIGGTAFYEDTYVRTEGGWRISHTGYRRVFEERRRHGSGQVVSFSSRFQAG